MNLGECGEGGFTHDTGVLSVFLDSESSFVAMMFLVLVRVAGASQ